MRSLLALVACMGCLSLGSFANAQSEPKDLAERQARLAERFEEFETLLERMGDHLANGDPERSALLKKAFAKSKKDLIGLEFDAIAKALDEKQYSKALDRQRALQEDMASLLELLVSQDRLKLLREEKQRLERLAKDVRKLIGQQRQIRSATERDQRGDAPTRLADKQGELKREAERLAKEAEASGENAPSDSKSAPSESPDSPPQQGSPQGSSGPQQDGKASPQKSLEQAREAMKDAQDHLQQQQRGPASEDQDKAIRDLKEAIRKIEEILRQLREEERTEMLASLESRLHKLIDMQQVLNRKTVELDKDAAVKESKTGEQKAIALSEREQEVVLGLDQILMLLREDGSAFAMPEAVQEARNDAKLVVTRLARGDASSFTQTLEESVLEALQDMLAAVKEELEQLRESKSGQGQAPGQGGPNAALINRLAELRMLRTLQYRVNKRTSRIGEELKGQPPTSEEMVDAVRQLAERQERIGKISREIATGAR
ncbi:hypothetical protein Pan216_19740 [Planctomycetes bacterium Pan216]|uniref:Chromosome partition protein Smc n=1 Tax=Kolteria novifilia TaxID=2527975 RepID=A0A518B2B0_9BACT|nr:hypothetical protein Pan216_19740 [Planctomycetes bacterium Pan216]